MTEAENVHSTSRTRAKTPRTHRNVSGADIPETPRTPRLSRRREAALSGIRDVMKSRGALYFHEWLDAHNLEQLSDAPTALLDWTIVQERRAMALQEAAEAFIAYRR